MSEEKKGEKKKGEKKQRLELTSLRVDTEKLTVSFRSVLRGKLTAKNPDKSVLWEIPEAETRVQGVTVPLSELLQAALVGFAWVRRVQDVLRKGSQKDAREWLLKDHTWAELFETVRKPAAEKTPAELLATFLTKLASGALSVEEKLALLAQLEALADGLQAQLVSTESNESSESGEESEDEE